MVIGIPSFNKKQIYIQMKITVSKIDFNLDKPLTIVSAKNLGNYHILIEFNDGVEKFVDFSNFLSIPA